MVVYVALLMILVGLALWPLRRKRAVLDVRALRGALGSPLARQLWRQQITPHLEPPRGSGLLPIFSYDLYPDDMRDLYDRSRALDGALLRALVAAPEDLGRRARIEGLQQVTRRVRRRLVMALVDAPGEPTVPELSRLEEALDEVADQIGALGHWRADGGERSGRWLRWLWGGPQARRGWRASGRGASYSSSSSSSSGGGVGEPSPSS